MSPPSFVIHHRLCQYGSPIGRGYSKILNHISYRQNVDMTICQTSLSWQLEGRSNAPRLNLRE